MQDDVWRMAFDFDPGQGGGEALARTRPGLEGEALVVGCCPDMRDKVELALHLMANPILRFRFRYAVGEQGVRVLATVREGPRHAGETAHEGRWQWTLAVVREDD